MCIRDRRCSVSGVSPGSTSTAFCARIGPPSGISLTRCTVAPLSLIHILDNVVISIDGRPEVHDRMRPTPNGKGSYDLIIEKAKEFARRRGQQRYYLRGTFTRYNLDFASDVLHLADQGFEQLSIEPVVTDESHDYAIRESDLPRVFEDVYKRQPMSMSLKAA